MADELTADGHGRRTRDAQRKPPTTRPPQHAATNIRDARDRRRMGEDASTTAGDARRTHTQRQSQPRATPHEQHLRTRGPRSSAAASQVAKHHTTYTAQLARSLTECQPQPPVRSVLRRQRGGLLGAVCLCGACSHGLDRGLRACLDSSRRTFAARGPQLLHRRREQAEDNVAWRSGTRRCRNRKAHLPLAILHMDTHTRNTLMPSATHVNLGRSRLLPPPLPGRIWYEDRLDQSSSLAPDAALPAPAPRCRIPQQGPRDSMRCAAALSSPPSPCPLRAGCGDRMARSPSAAGAGR
mmetsp:Transcript_22714/g.73564  ORF Transcript_22714/g.73564 Transcript_22714/m.73564 type:complete len:296 (-) Transcript_22714:2048-2935(-)